MSGIDDIQSQEYALQETEPEDRDSMSREYVVRSRP